MHLMKLRSSMMKSGQLKEYQGLPRFPPLGYSEPDMPINALPVAESNDAEPHHPCSLRSDVADSPSGTQCIDPFHSSPEQSADGQNDDSNATWSGDSLYGRARLRNGDHDDAHQ